MAGGFLNGNIPLKWMITGEVALFLGNLHGLLLMENPFWGYPH
jgi:hypothetical protein